MYWERKRVKHNNFVLFEQSKFRISQSHLIFKSIMTATIITTEDLKVFKEELLDDIKKLLDVKSTSDTKKWLKSIEVRKLLGVSSGTLQNYRINGSLAYTKIGGTLFYSSDDIEKLLSQNKINTHK